MTWFVDRIQELIGELRRRRVVHVAVLYAGTSFVILELAGILVEPFGLPSWTVRLITLVLLLGFPLAIGLAWVFDITEDGLIRTEQRDESGREGAPKQISETSSTVSIGLVVVLAAGLLWVGWQTVFQSGPSPDASRATPAVVDDANDGLDAAKVAVLYFDDNSPGDTLTAFAGAFTEHVIHRLAQVEQLDVKSRHAVKPYRERSPPLDSLAQILDAGSLVEGSISPAGDSLAVFVQLIDGTTQSHLMSEVVRRPAAEIFALQEDLAREVAELLRKRLGGEVQLESWRAGTNHPKAWQLVQRADRLRRDAERALADGQTGTGQELLGQAESLLDAAETIDPEWSAPRTLRARLAAAQVDPYGERWGEPEREIARGGIRYAEEALERDATSAEARMLRGQLRFWLSQQMENDEDVRALADNAEADLRSAIREDPQLAEAMYTLSRLLVEVRADFDQARYYAERAQETDAYLRVPHHWHYQLFYTAFNAGEFDDAAHWCHTGQKNYPELAQFWDCELVLLASEGGPEPDADRAWQLVQEIRQRTEPERRSLYGRLARPHVAAVLARLGQADSARAVLGRMRAEREEPHPAVAYFQAHAYLLLGERGKAIDLLDQCVRQSPRFAETLSEDIWFADLRDEPGFQELVAR